MLAAQQLVILFMRADPYPFKATLYFTGNRSLMVAHTDRESSLFAMELLEAQGRMPRVGSPKKVVFVGQRLNMRRELIIQFPKPGGCLGLHEVSGGQSCIVRACRSSSASLKRKSSRPVLASSSICRSRSLFRRAIKRSVNSQNCSRERRPMAASISATVLRAESYRLSTLFSTLNPHISTVNPICGSTEA